MHIELSHNNVEYIIADRPFFEWLYLQRLASEYRIKSALGNSRDEFYQVAVINGEPAFSATASNGGLYPDTCLRSFTRFYANPRYRNSLTPGMFKFGINMIPNLCDKQFYFISRHPSAGKLSASLIKTGWVPVDDQLFLVGKNPDNPLDWRYIYYKGTLDEFSVPTLSLDHYAEKFS